MSQTRFLPRNTNQVRGLAQYAIDFLHLPLPPGEGRGEGSTALPLPPREGRGEGPPASFSITDSPDNGPSRRVLDLVEKFFLDSLLCGVSALAAGTNAPTILRAEALDYPALNPARGATLFGSSTLVHPEKAVLANCAAVREWDSNGTNFGYDPARGNTAGEFGHNDFYPVVVAAAQQCGWNGPQLLRGMLALDEIRGRLAEVFSLKSHKIDHVVHGAIASAVVYGAALGCTVDQIESAVGLFIAHAIPFRAIRHGQQLSDSKGASAAISTELAIQAVHRAQRGFVGPADIFRNPEAIFCLFERPARQGESPFDLELALSGDDFAIAGMHFKLGLYEHQSAGAIQGVLDLLAAEPGLLDSADAISEICVTIYEPAYHIICDPYKWRPATRQSADHSLPYIIATLLRKALEQRTADWQTLMLLPEDYSTVALGHPVTRALMERVKLEHGGAEFDRRYPEGIPTRVAIAHRLLGTLQSELVMFPTGHARNTAAPLADLLAYKFHALASMASGQPGELIARLGNIAGKSSTDVRALYDFRIHGME